MILVRIEHFLSEEGCGYFPDWLRCLAGKLEKQQGFQEVRWLKEANATVDGCSLLLEFDSQEMLERWVATEEHARAVARLEPYTLKPLRSTCYYAERVVV